jgi:hypothetical protein
MLEVKRHHVFSSPLSLSLSLTWKRIYPESFDFDSIFFNLFAYAVREDGEQRGRGRGREGEEKGKAATYDSLSLVLSLSLSFSRSLSL